MIFSTNYMQSLAGAPQRHSAAIQDNNNHLIIIINLLFDGRQGNKGIRHNSAKNIKIIRLRPLRWTILGP